MGQRRVHGDNFFSQEIKTHNPTMQITSLTSIFFSTLLSSSLSGSHFRKYYKHHQAKPKTAPQQSIPEIVSTNSDFSTLLAAVSAAGLVEALSAEGPFTVFAPTNEAFAKIPSESLASLLEDKAGLTAVLARHVIAGSSIMAGDIQLGVTAVETLGGEEVEVIRAGSCVALRSEAGTAQVVTADVVATNGVVHVVDTV